VDADYLSPGAYEVLLCPAPIQFSDSYLRTFPERWPQRYAAWCTMYIGDNGGLIHDEAEALAAGYGVTVGYDGYELVL